MCLTRKGEERDDDTPGSAKSGNCVLFLLDEGIDVGCQELDAKRVIVVPAL
jgi:hypothetical protein